MMTEKAFVGLLMKLQSLYDVHKHNFEPHSTV